MKTSGLHTYLQDHTAGAESAMVAMRALSEQTHDRVLSHLLSELLIEVAEDKQELEKLAHSVGSEPNVFKNAAAWMAAQVVDLKARAGKTSFGAFEGLEFVSLGIQGKLHLWRALQRSAICTSSSYQLDYSLLIKRAESQHERVEVVRLALASKAL